MTIIEIYMVSKQFDSIGREKSVIQTGLFFFVCFFANVLKCCFITINIHCKKIVNFTVINWKKVTRTNCNVNNCQVHVN